MATGIADLPMKHRDFNRGKMSTFTLEDNALTVSGPGPWAHFHGKDDFQLGLAFLRFNAEQEDFLFSWQR